jgi:predicted aminopeptidase
VWNVVAAPRTVCKLKTWCFPVMGCVGYRGYFDRDEAEPGGALCARGSRSASTACRPTRRSGWTTGLGGDPLLNTFIQWPEGELARLIFHELAHQVAYAADDTMFNESFATAVERIGGARWLAAHASATRRARSTPRSTAPAGLPRADHGLARPPATRCTAPRERRGQARARRR